MIYGEHLPDGRSVTVIPFVVSMAGHIHRYSTNSLRRLGLPEETLRALQRDIAQLCVDRVGGMYAAWRKAACQPGAGDDRELR